MEPNDPFGLALNQYITSYLISSVTGLPRVLLLSMKPSNYHSLKNVVQTFLIMFARIKKEVDLMSGGGLGDIEKDISDLLNYAEELGANKAQIKTIAEGHATYYKTLLDCNIGEEMAQKLTGMWMFNQGQILASVLGKKKPKG